MTTMQCREKYWTDANFYKDQNGQAHFPNVPLQGGELTSVNPWSLKSMPKRPIKLKEAA